MKKKSQFGFVLTIFLVSVVTAIILFSTANTNITNNSALDDDAELTVEAEIDNRNEPNAAILEYEVLFNLEVDVGCKIGLGNDKEQINPSKQWQYHLEFTAISGEIKDLDTIIEGLVEDWLENNIKNKGRKKKMLERYVIISYNYDIIPGPA